jgi:hypothetical protein
MSQMPRHGIHLENATSRPSSRTIMSEKMKLVPVEPTEDMLVAGTEVWLVMQAQEERAEAIYKAMLAATPDVLQPSVHEVKSNDK